MAQRTSPLLRWLVIGGMTASLVAGLALAFWPMVAADRALQAFCGGLADGTPLATVRARAEALGYTAAPIDNTTLRIEDPAGFGRRQCALALNSQAQISQPTPQR